jgi:hypothetical protein
MEQDRVRLRSEAEAPWRSLRLTLYGFSVASAGMGTLISIPQLIGALGSAPGALPVEQVLQNIGINVGAVSIFAFLFSRDWQVRGCFGRELLTLCKDEQRQGEAGTPAFDSGLADVLSGACWHGFGHQHF